MSLVALPDGYCCLLPSLAVRLTLLDSTEKKVAFLREATELVARLPGSAEREVYAMRVAALAGIPADAVTAEVAELDFGMMARIVERITHEVKGVNRVLWDITPKPTGTIEWE